MINHKIYIFKSPKISERIGYVISKEADESHKPLPVLLSRLLDDYDIATHRLFTNSKDIKSIVRLDPFFTDIIFYTDLDEFSKRVIFLNKEGLPSPVELSKLVLSKISLDKLQLQKVMYLIYSVSLERGYKILNESPVAYKYGPVFEDVFREYYHYNSKELIEEKPSIRERIALSKSLSNSEILPIVDEVLEIVKGRSGSNLIEITHAEEGPWEKVYIEGKNAVIDDDTILKYNHKVLAKIS